ncbi:DUF4190 domain-containing protein [Nocardioides sp. HM23]|uniref:DUF4190 domain-containing protein n=1 Tax=Nocardioides bizhenqiangii TaxID=3095076 RepID=UPI002ACA0C5C|nr:DUF4190 domain-containing protein [Nocardioides sp. HM23]MDZ5620262.1 DUF4190 domain-containing protein [Nocardioides sp. HM23]
MSTPPWGEEPAEPTPPPPPPPPNPYGHQQQPVSPYQPYGAPPSPYGGYPVPKQTNGLAIASLVVSIVSIAFCCGFPGVAGAIMGHVARKQIREQDQTGDGMALAGIIVGWASFGLAVIGTILFVSLGIWADTTTDCYYDSNGTYVCD